MSSLRRYIRSPGSSNRVAEGVERPDPQLVVGATCGLLRDSPVSGKESALVDGRDHYQSLGNRQGPSARSPAASRTGEATAISGTSGAPPPGPCEDPDPYGPGTGGG